MPTDAAYEHYLDSHVADLKNTPPRKRGGSSIAARFLAALRRRRALGAPGHRRRGRASTARRASIRTPGATGFGVRLDRRAGPRSRRGNLPGAQMDFDLSRRARAPARHGPRVRRGAGRPGRRGARPRAPLPVRARGRAGRARAHGHPDPRGVRRRGRRHARLRDRDRGADPDRLVRRDHRRRAHVARDDADLPVRLRGAEGARGSPISPRASGSARSASPSRARARTPARRRRAPTCATGSGS